MNKLHKVYDYFISNDGGCKFHIRNVNMIRLSEKSILYNQFQPYDKILKSMQEK